MTQRINLQAARTGRIVATQEGGADRIISADEEGAGRIIETQGGGANRIIIAQEEGAN